jgi:hypothetical protein
MKKFTQWVSSKAVKEQANNRYQAGTMETREPLPTPFLSMVSIFFRPIKRRRYAPKAASPISPFFVSSDTSFVAS